MSDYGNREQKVLDYGDKAINNIKNRLNLEELTKPNNDMEGKEQALSRVRFDPSTPKYVSPTSNDNILNNTTASSFVIILCGVLLLVFLVGIITLTVLKRLNI